MHVHGSRHPELSEVAGLFGRLGHELLLHLDREEKVLFPAIKEAVKTRSAEALKTIAGELPGMSGEHEFVGGTMDKINEITGGYKVPADGCNTYAVTYKLLNEFEEDLHIHVHLENNILFPKSLNL
jgi:regulator of cell morphogenesis and NO signaling